MFVIVPGVINQAGTGAILSMSFAVVIAISIAFVYAELASAFPVAGGEYSMIGRAIGPGAGFAALGLTITGNTFATAVLALGTSDYLAVVIPGLNPLAVGITLIALATLLGILHIRTNAWITGIFLLLELLALAVLAALGFIDIERPLPELITHPVVLVGGELQPTPVAMIGLATSVAIFAYSGYGAAVYFAEEMHEAPRLVARTILWALAITVITELVPSTAALLGTPRPEGAAWQGKSVRRVRDHAGRAGARHRHQPERRARHLQRGAGDAFAERAFLLLDRARRLLAPAHQQGFRGHP